MHKLPNTPSQINGSISPWQVGVVVVVVPVVVVPVVVMVMVVVVVVKVPVVVDVTVTVVAEVVVLVVVDVAEPHVTGQAIATAGCLHASQLAASHRRLYWLKRISSWSSSYSAADRHLFVNGTVRQLTGQVYAIKRLPQKPLACAATSTHVVN